MIEEARAAVATAVNTGLTILYWRIGKRINEEILKGKRADYGQKILATLSQELVSEHGQGFSYSALTRMVRFAESFPGEETVATLSQRLSWSHFRELLPLDKPLQREFYAEMCRVERWSVRPFPEYKESGVPWSGESAEHCEILPLGWRLSDKTGYEISFTRYFYKPKPLRTLEEIRTELLAVKREGEGLLTEILGWE